MVIHPLADDRRVLPIDKLGELLQATPEFALVISFNPGYQSVLKDLKQSTRQRFVALEFDYPGADVEAKNIGAETGIPHDAAERLVFWGGRMCFVWYLSDVSRYAPEEHPFSLQGGSNGVRGQA